MRPDVGASVAAAAALFAMRSEFSMGFETIFAALSPPFFVFKAADASIVEALPYKNELSM